METSTTFAFADLCGYTALTDHHGDESAADVALAFESLVRSALPPDVALVKTIGDAVMLAGADPTDLVRAVIRAIDAAEKTPNFPAVRAGLHRGPAVERNGDWFGASVNIAARLCGHARPGELLCSADLARACGDAPDLTFHAEGTLTLKNVTAPLPACRVNRSTGPLWLVDPICRMRVDPTHPIVLVVEGRELHFCSESCRATFQQRGGRLADHSM